MSPHQRALSRLASTLKSRRTKSARAAAAGSAMVVFVHRFGVRPRSLAARISRAIRFLTCRRPALRHAMDLFDRFGQLGVVLLAARGAVAAVRVVGGTGDLQQLARPLDVAL